MMVKVIENPSECKYRAFGEWCDHPKVGSLAKCDWNNCPLSEAPAPALLKKAEDLLERIDDFLHTAYEGPCGFHDEIDAFIKECSSNNKRGINANPY